VIALWGPSRSGKTALLSYLFIRADTNPRWKVSATPESWEAVRNRSARIRKRNEFPEGTTEGNELSISYTFEDRETRETFRLETKDRAGVRSERMSEKEDAEFIQSLAAAAGIVLLLNHDTVQYENDVAQTLSQVKLQWQAEGAGKRPRPLAVCMSKVDELIRGPEELKRLRDSDEEQERFVSGRLSAALRAPLAEDDFTVKYFAVSSVGLELSHGLLQKSVFYDERLWLRTTDRGTPMNLVEPFVWIFKTSEKRT